MLGHTAAQTQYFDVIAVFWTRQCKQSRCKEHSLIVGVSDEEQYALVLQCRERSTQGAGVHPEAEEDEGHRGPGYPVHSEELGHDYSNAPGEQRGLLRSPLARSGRAVVNEEL